MWKPLVVLAIVANTALITPSEAHRKCKKPNEIYDLCPNPCPPRECGINIALILCAPAPKPGSKDCRPGCRCADGFLKNRAGICIPEDECQYDCPKNETIDPCYSECPPRYCGINIAAVSCLAIDENNCERKCRCSDGFLRNAEGVCILEKDCPKCKGANETYDVCPNPCPPQRCDVDPRVIRCAAPPEPGDEECEPGCRCFDGYARNEDGICISRDECPLMCGGDPNAVSGCGKNCGRHCSDRNKTEPVVCTADCEVNGCDCRKGFWYDDNTGKCVLANDCTPTCGKDEVYSTCTNSDCGPQKCSQLGFPIPCPRIAFGNCIKGCVCKQGLVRATNGTCIPKNKCPSCRGDPNAVSGCGNCVKSCSNHNSTEPMICLQFCELNGCDCKEGFVLDDSSGKCIRPNKCVSCGGDFNAQPGCDKNCTRRCPSPKPVECKCYEDSCECKDGFLYDTKIGKCVHPEQCTPPCGNNEVLSNCSNGGCGPWRCTDVGFQTGCVKMDPKNCIVDCVCNEGYVRDNQEVCIPVTDCPKCGGDPNAISGCGINCGRLCSNYKQAENVSCIALCEDNACDCREGFVKDENINKCVYPEDCTPVCGINQVFSPCVNGGCQVKNCSQIGEPVPCIKPAKCNPGCLCAEGYLRDDNGICIPKDQCPPKCTGANEIYDSCPPSCPPQICESIGQEYFCPLMLTTNKTCHGACRCKPNFLRNKIGECISTKDCLKCTGPNEYFSCSGACDNVCKSLSTQNKTNCPIINIQCNEMCYCEDGYARNKSNICIPIDQCPPTPVCKKHEVYSECINGGCQARNCSQLGQPVPCIKLDPKACIKGCVCEDGYLRASNGTCVPKYTCDTPKCGENERLEECPDWLCTPQTCDQLGKPIACPALLGDISPNATCPGKPGCVCIDNYVRHDCGECIPVDECPSCGGDPNAVSGCGTNCGRLCSNYKKKNNICTFICKINSCDCREEFVFDSNIDKCVLPEDCTQVCGLNEVYDTCANGGCQKRNCSQAGQPMLCIDPINCIGGCVCQKGFLRHENGTCVPEKECPSPKCGKNERLEDCPDWLCTPQTCDQLGKPIACPALLGDISPNGTCPGKPGCVCIDNYVRHDCGECIPVDECPSCGGDPNAVSGCGTNCGRLCSNYKEKNIICTFICKINSCDCREEFVFDSNIDKCVLPEECTQVCGLNEVYDTCANGGCQNRNCSQVGQPTLCIDPIKCIGGCVCQEGFLRHENGTCVPEKVCPLDCTKRHEVYDPCPHTCPPQTCTAIGVPYDCPNPPEGEEFCQPACRCEDGYYRNSVDECISEEDCLKCTGINEHFSCGPECDNVCKTLSEQNQTNCPIKNKKCISQCYCDEGYARDDNRICISIDQCGVSCHGDPNAIPGCGSHCNDRCSNYNERVLACPLFCLLDGCDCKPGYIFDDNLGKCVLPKDCTPVCGADEVYNACINGGCQKKNCSDLARPIICIHPKECIDGCLCKEGMLRADNGTCVPIDDCPTPVCPKNEVFDRCANGGCHRRKCSELAGPIICTDPDECIGDCVCVKGYLRNEDGVCVPEIHCNPQCLKPHQVFDFCPSTCPPQTCESLDMAYICPIEWGQEPPCQPACVCEKGYFFNLIGECVSEEDCLKCMGPHEYHSCGGACDNVCLTLNEQSQANCPIVNIKCNEKCYCEEGYARNASDVCIPIKDCPPSRCGPDERYEESPCRVCEPLTCCEVGKKLECLPVEDDDCDDTPGCICKYGLVRNDDGVCIPISECR